MKKIEIKLKECCLKCEHFDSSGIQGLSTYPLSCCGEPERVIACGHMAVCKEYNDDCKNSTDSVIRCRDCAHCIQHNSQPFCHIHSEYTSSEYFCGSAVKSDEQA